MGGGCAVTVTCVVTPSEGRTMSMCTVEPSVSVTPVCLYGAKPGWETGTSYKPGDNSPIRYAPSPLAEASRPFPVPTSRTMTFAPAMRPPLESLTEPSSAPVTADVCPQPHEMDNMRMKPRMKYLFRREVIVVSACGCRLKLTAGI